MSKIGPHAIQPSGAALEWAQHAPVVKSLSVPVLQAAQPGAITVYRHYWPDSEQNNLIASLAVDQTLADVLQGLGGFVPAYVEVFNEVAQRQGLGLERHADFMEGFVPKAHDAGLKVAGFSFSTGNPGSSVFGDPDDFQYLYNRGWCGCDAIALHCYFGTDGFDRAYALRYRALCSTVPSHPPLLITETGIDAVPGGAKGWMAAGISGDEYLNLLAAYDAELQQDDCVLGATVFTAGPTPDWNAFSTDGLDMSRFYSIPGDTTVADDSAVQQVLDQNALIADALYDLVRELEETDTAQSAALIQDAKTKINALNPAKFTFP